MKLIYFTFSLCIVILSSCTSFKNDLAKQIEIEINSLKTIKEKENYLVAILEIDQGQRILNNKSVKVKLDSNARRIQDKINLLKIEKYLERFGHPDKASFNSNALDAPWVVIHHAEGLDVRKKHFKTIYSAYLRGDIPDNAISFYLTRMYDIKHNWKKSHFMENPYTIEEQIETLAMEIGIAEEQKEILAHFKLQ